MMKFALLIGFPSILEDETFTFCLDTGAIAVDEEKHSYGLIRSKLGFSQPG